MVLASYGEKMSRIATLKSSWNSPEQIDEILFKMVQTTSPLDVDMTRIHLQDDPSPEVPSESKTLHGQVVRGLGNTILLENIDSEEANRKYTLDFRDHPELKPSFSGNYLEGSYVVVSGTVHPSYITPFEILVQTFVFDTI